MTRKILYSILAIGILQTVLPPIDASAAGFIHKSFNCPRTNATVIPAGGRIQISDIILSANGNTNVTVFFSPPTFRLMIAYLKGRDSFVSNFQGQVEGDKDQALMLNCTGAVPLSITVVGTGSL